MNETEIRTTRDKIAQKNTILSNANFKLLQEEDRIEKEKKEYEVLCGYYWPNKCTTPLQARPVFWKMSFGQLD